MIVSVLDLEATCWAEPSDIPSEIIQIGVSSFDTVTMKVADPVTVLVKPRRVTELSEYCTNLTGLTNEQVFGRGSSFPDALQELNDRVHLNSRTMVSWGTYDFVMMRDARIEYDMLPKEMTRRHLDLKSMYRLMGYRASGLDSALKELNLEMQGRWHDAGADAFNTARILQHLYGELNLTRELRNLLKKHPLANIPK